MKSIYHVFHYNAYDGMDHYGDKTKDELKSMLKQTGYNKVNINDLMVIEGREMSDEELKKLLLDND
mgnify:CR=1 FL=1